MNQRSAKGQVSGPDPVREALLEVLAEARRRPLAELRAALAAHAVADGQHRRQGVVFDLARNRAITLGSNHPGSPDGCLGLHLALLEDVAEVLVDRAHVLVEQRGHLRLREPQRLALEAADEPRAAVVGRVEDQLGVGRRGGGHRGGSLVAQRG